MAKITEQLRIRLSELGINNFENPDKSDIEILVKVAAIDRNIVFDYFKSYLNACNYNIYALSDVFKEMASKQHAFSGEGLRYINQARIIFENELNKDISEETRQKIYNRKMWKYFVRMKLFM